MRVNRGLLGWGVFFIVAGSVPLLVQAGVLDPARVRQVWQLWPLILVGIGLGLILQRTRAAILGGLVVAATFGILVGGWFAVGFVPGSGFGACGIGGSNDAGRAFPTQTGTLQASATVKLDLSCGDATITSATGSAWTVEGTSDDGTPPTITSDGDLLVQSPHHSGIDFGHGSRWQVTLPSDGSVQLDLSANAGSIDAALGAMQVPNLSASVNAGSATIDMAEVTGLETLDISANAGSLSLTLPTPDDAGQREHLGERRVGEDLRAGRRGPPDHVVDQPRVEQLRRPRSDQGRRHVGAAGPGRERAADLAQRQRKPRQREPEPGGRL